MSRTLLSYTSAYMSENCPCCGFDLSAHANEWFGPFSISQSMAKLTGLDPSVPHMRPEVIKAICAYVTLHNLNNPENKSEIYTDEALLQLTGMNIMTYQQLQDRISVHLGPVGEPVEECS